MCDSWRPVERARSVPSARVASSTRIAWSRSALRRAGASSCARPRGGSAAPCSASSAGRTKSRKVTSAETGLPGRPKTSESSRVPNHVGLPGCSATRQNVSVTPSVSSAGLTWSCGPTETPPEITTTRAASSAPARIRSLATRSSGTIAVWVTTPPSRLACAARPTRFELWISPGPSGAPGGRSSSPVQRIATVGRAATGTVARPAATAAASSAGPSRVPAATTSAPATRSSPGPRTFAPGLASTCSVTAPSRSSASSWRTTASAPDGSAAPVEIRAAVAASSGPGAGWPARDSCATGSVRPAGPETTA